MAVHLVGAYEATNALNGLTNFNWLDSSAGELLQRIDSSDADNLKARQGFNRIIGARVGSASMVQARFRQTSLNVPVLGRHIFPVASQILPEADVPIWADWRRYPLEIAENEELQIQGDNGNTSEDVSALVWFADGGSSPVSPQAGDFWVRATSGTDLTTDVWTTSTWTLDDSLEKGDYAMLGGVVDVDAGLAWRVVRDEDNHRPGGLCTQAPASPQALVNLPWATGGFGILDTFEHDEFPDIQILDNAATTSEHEGWFLLRKVV